VHCGANWQPHVIKRVIETFQTSTRVARVATDTGNGFLKGLGNPAGTMALAAELVAGELAAWFGLKIPDFALISVGQLPIPMIDGGHLLAGPAFISREIDGFGGLGGPGFAQRIANPSDIARLVVFDTWVRNADRCHPAPENYPPNYDNLFFTPSGPKFRVVALDHSQAFVESGLEASLSDQYVINDDGVYGYFPEFADLIKFEAVTAAVAKLRQIDANFVAEVIASIPAQWAISQAARAAWANVITQRAANVANYLPRKLLNNPGLDL
jgi:hypothetical protein